MEPMRSILSIAGFDTSCGAGICADVKTARSLSFYACTAITAITYQNTCGIQGVRPVSKEELYKQLKPVLEDISLDAIKIGMVPDVDTAEVIIETLRGLEVDVPIVLDPVIKSTTGFEVGSSEIYSRVMDNCTVVTPNVYEAEQLTGLDIADIKSAKKAVLELSAGSSVVITGVNGKDIIFDAENESIHVLGKELKIGKVHGTGCVYSTSLACYLADGLELFNACKKARRLTISAARRAVEIGNCLPLVDP